MTHKIVLIDNYDSFVYNIARYFVQLGCQCHVFRNDRISIQEVIQLNPTHIVISPGPCTPDEAGISLELIKALYRSLPMLGICLGHQAIGQVFGGEVTRALKPMHGRASQIQHEGTDIFSGLSSPITIGRYHSLIVKEQNLSADIKITARSAEGEVMALAHQYYPLQGVQFHPESVLTEYGYEMLQNFINLS